MPYPMFDDGYYTPINDIIAVTPSDSTDLQYNGRATPCRALILNGTGNIAFITGAGTTVTLAITANWWGVTYIRARRVLATGTTMGVGTIFACY